MCFPRFSRSRIYNMEVMLLLAHRFGSWHGKKMTIWGKTVLPWWRRWNPSAPLYLICYFIHVVLFTFNSAVNLHFFEGTVGITRRGKKECSFSCCTNISHFTQYIRAVGQLLQAEVSSRCGTKSVWGLQPATSVVISVKLNFYYLVIKAAAMSKPDGFLLTLQLLLFYGVGENWTKGSCVLYKIKAIIPTFLRHGGASRRAAMKVEDICGLLCVYLWIYAL